MPSKRVVRGNKYLLTFKGLWRCFWKIHISYKCIFKRAYNRVNKGDSLYQTLFKVENRNLKSMNLNLYYFHDNLYKDKKSMVWLDLGQPLSWITLAFDLYVLPHLLWFQLDSSVRYSVFSFYQFNLWRQTCVPSYFKIPQFIAKWMSEQTSFWHLTYMSDHNFTL